MLKVAIQMDPLEAVNVESDTTFLMALSGQARGHKLWIYDFRTLALDEGRLFCRARPVTVNAVQGEHADFGPEVVLDLAEDVDVILMRQDPPFDMAYVTATYLLERVHPKTLVVNNPAEVRSAPEKLIATLFPGLQPPTLVSSDPAAPCRGLSTTSPWRRWKSTRATGSDDTRVGGCRPGKRVAISFSGAERTSAGLLTTRVFGCTRSSR